jgi:hypothetical protein
VNDAAPVPTIRKKRGKAPTVEQREPPPKNDWRLQKYEVVPIDSIRPRDDNANEGDDDAVAESMDENGKYGAVLVGPDDRIIAGATRWRRWKASGEPECAIIRLSVEEERAVAIMIADNETRRGAKTNENKLADLLPRLASHRGLGLKPPDVTALLERARPRVSYLDAMRSQQEAAALPETTDDPEDEDGGDEHDYTDVSDDYDGGPRDREDEVPRFETARIPLSIVLTNTEARKWTDYKKSVGERRDVDAFRVLLAAATRTDA